MLTRIELTNFMAHAHTVIEPAAGLTVLVGPNNCGKSAVVAALQILCHNDNSTYVLRHGEKECSVQVTTDDGHTILWRRKKSPSYEIDGEPKDRLKIAGHPELLHAVLRLPLVEGSGDDRFDVHFGEQKSPIFLLNNSSATAARFFASSSDASRLVAMQKKHKDRLAERQKEKNRLEAESKQLAAELKSLEQVPDLDRQLQAVEKQHGELLRRGEQLEQARQAAVALAQQLGALGRCEALAKSLAPLASPPALAPTEPLANLIGASEGGQAALALTAARAEKLAALPEPPKLFEVAALARTADQLVAHGKAAERAEAEGNLLAALHQPPQLAETAPLERLVQQLADAAAQRQRWEATAQRAARIAAPPLPVDVSSLRETASQLETALAQIGALNRELADANGDLNAAALALREAAAGQLCPTCGAPLDADRLLAAAPSGFGGHAHG